MKIKELKNYRDYNKLEDGDVVTLAFPSVKDLIDVMCNHHKYNKKIYVITKNRGIELLGIKHFKQYVRVKFNSHIVVDIPLEDDRYGKKKINCKAFKAVLATIKSLIKVEEDRSFIEYSKYNGEYKSKCSPSEADVIEEQERIAKIFNGITYELKGCPDSLYWEIYVIKTIQKYNIVLPKFRKALPESYKFDILEALFDNYHIEDKYEKRALLKEIFKLTKDNDDLFIDYLKFKHSKPELDFYMILLRFNEERRKNILNKLEEQDRLYDVEEGGFNVQLVDFDLRMDRDEEEYEEETDFLDDGYELDILDILEEGYEIDILD